MIVCRICGLEVDQWEDDRWHHDPEGDYPADAMAAERDHVPDPWPAAFEQADA